MNNNKKTLSNIQELRICHSLNLGKSKQKSTHEEFIKYKKKKKPRRCSYGTLKKHSIQIMRIVMIPVSTVQLKSNTALNMQE